VPGTLHLAHINSFFFTYNQSFLQWAESRLASATPKDNFSFADLRQRGDETAADRHHPQNTELIYQKVRRSLQCSPPKILVNAIICPSIESFRRLPGTASFSFHCSAAITEIK
jgi:hypothetical protein